MASQYVVGAQIAPRPVLEQVKFPLYDRQDIATAAVSTTFFQRPIGSADTSALNGTSRTLADTNLVRAGTLPTPKNFQVFAVSARPEPGITRADMNAFLNQTSVQLIVGEKSYLQIRLDAIPGGNGIQVQQLQVAADAVTNGWPLASNLLDVTVPEELADPADPNRSIQTGRRVPLQLISEQAFSAIWNYAGTFTLGATTAWVMSLEGILQREVM